MNMEGQPVESAAAETQELNLFQRLMMVFMAPSKLGEYLRSRQPWFWTLAVAGVIGIIIFWLIPSDIFVAMMEQQARGGPQGQEFDADSALKLGRSMGTVFGLLGYFIGAAVIAGVVYLAFNVMLGGGSTYKQHFSAAAHMYWISLLGGILLLPLIMAREDMSVRLGLGLLLPEEPSTLPTHFLNSINLFALWAAAALGAMESGMSGGRISVGKGVTTVIGLYIVWAIIAASWATLTGSMF